jgi:hypothetical protein
MDMVGGHIFTSTVYQSQQRGTASFPDLNKLEKIVAYSPKIEQQRLTLMRVPLTQCSIRCVYDLVHCHFQVLCEACSQIKRQKGS